MIIFVGRFFERKSIVWKKSGNSILKKRPSMYNFPEMFTLFRYCSFIYNYMLIFVQCLLFSDKIKAAVNNTNRCIVQLSRKNSQEIPQDVFDLTAHEVPIETVDQLLKFDAYLSEKEDHETAFVSMNS